MYNLVICAVLSVAAAEITVPGIDRTITDGVQSKGYKIVYGDQDLEILNEVISDMEKKDVLQKEINLREAIQPLPAEDVKCLMSVDKYCSKEMRQVKGVLIQALKDDCQKCSDEEKNHAGHVVASMMAHDPVAWKLFLTRCALHSKSDDNIPPKQEIVKFKPIGKPEILKSKHKYLRPGIKVRVKRYIADKIP